MIAVKDSLHDLVRASNGTYFERRLVVLEQGLCYKVLAQGEASVGELELRLIDDHGALAQEDAMTGSGAVLGSVRPICPLDVTTYHIEARGSGPGVVFAQVYASP